MREADETGLEQRRVGVQVVADAVDAELLWQFQVGKGALGPPITFRVDSHQRIAVASRQGLARFGLAEGQ